MSSISISPANSSIQLSQAKLRVAEKSQQSSQNTASKSEAQPNVFQATMAQKNAATKSPQAGGNGVPPKPVSTSTKAVQYFHRINVQA